MREYNYLLTSQLEEQRKYFEEKVNSCVCLSDIDRGSSTSSEREPPHQIVGLLSRGTRPLIEIQSTTHPKHEQADSHVAKVDQCLVRKGAEGEGGFGDR